MLARRGARQHQHACNRPRGRAAEDQRQLDRARAKRCRGRTGVGIHIFAHPEKIVWIKFLALLGDAAALRSQLDRRGAIVDRRDIRARPDQVVIPR